MKILFGLKFRYVLISFALLVLVLCAAGYFSVRAGKKATLAGLIDQGRALTTVLVASASNIIESDRQITDVAIDKLLTEVGVLRPKAGREAEQRLLEELSRRLRLLKAALYDRDLKLLVAVDNEPRNVSEIVDSLQQNFLSNVNLEDRFDIIYDFHQVQDQRLLFGVLPYSENRLMFIVYPWEVGQYADQTLSLAYLLNQLSREAGIEYIMLQNLDGIVFASKEVSQANRIEDDPFLGAGLESDTAISRLVEFQDREVLEIVAPFNSGDEFYGLFRVGMSLFGYRQLLANFQRQVWLFVGLLLVLGLVGLGIVVSYQNLSIMEDTLNRARAFSQSLQDSIPGIVLSTDENLRIVTANNMARKHFGLPEGPPRNWDYGRYVPEDPFKVKEVLDSKRPVNFETRIRGSAGPVDLLVSTSTLLSDRGEPTGVIVVAHDISEKRELERRAQHDHRLAELGTVAAGLAHEIRNPLNGISIAIQRMQKEVVVAEGHVEFKELVAVINKEINRLRASVEKVVQVAKSSRPELRQTEIAPLIEEVVSLLRYEASDRGVEMTTALEPGKAYVNEASFKTIITNLVKNAIEAVSRGGHVKIVARFETDKLMVTVEDDGPGIAPELLKDLFAPFRTTKVFGTGLGLATARKSAEDHGGTLEADSRVGGPTRFTLTIPRKG